MGFEGESERAVVVHHMLGERHHGERHLLLGAGFGGVGVVEERQRNFLGQAAHLPESLAAVET